MAPLRAGALLHSYYFYSAVLVLKLIALAPLASLICNPDKVQRAHSADLKHLGPFWLVSGIYMTTSPDPATALALMRAFVAARFVMLLGYLYEDVPKMAKELAFFVSFLVTAFMGFSVMVYYSYAL